MINVGQRSVEYTSHAINGLALILGTKLTLLVAANTAKYTTVL